MRAAKHWVLVKRGDRDSSRVSACPTPRCRADKDECRADKDECRADKDECWADKDERRGDSSGPARLVVVSRGPRRYGSR